MKILFTVLGLATACVFHAGCFSMSTASSEALSRTQVVGAYGRPREQVVVSNYGWYLFNTFPIVCGNATRGAWFPWSFFRNDVTTDIVHERLTDYAAERHADLAEMNFFFNENMLFAIPGTSIPIPMPYILCYRERLISGLLMDPPSPTPAPQGACATSTAAPANVTPALQPADGAGTPPAPSPDFEQRKRELNRLLDKIPDGGVK